jgi:hypothetical protein
MTASANENIYPKINILKSAMELVNLNHIYLGNNTAAVSE